MLNYLDILIIHALNLRMHMKPPKCLYIR